ncbi:zinc finger BED domain-containing protein RICESLEEPER 2-like [Rhizophagus irregularis DAOM 181602=DAOM 197198]|nr:zinc finger BED domain-containing protein RICESLEEPER 2-like [Rhizophagus irregularis DAOM 181602=DAOM 197198]
MFKIFDPRYQVPNRQNLKEMVVNKFNTIRKNIGAFMAQIPGKIALTADMWTSKFTNDAFLGLTVHYIDQKWKLQNFLLDIISFTKRHTGINIATSINNVLNDFNLQEKTLALTTDNESAMIVCGRTLRQQLITQLDSQNFRHYRCAAHILNLAAQQGLEMISDEVIKVRELMNKIKHSIVISDQLKNLCSYAKITYLRPELDCKTRWNSTFNMLRKLEKMWRGLQLLAVENKEIQNLMPTNNEWKIIKDTLTVLEPLEKATVYLSAARYPTIADVRFVFLGILDYLNDLIGSEEFSQNELASSINQKIDDYWKYIDEQTLVAAILDPRTKLTLFESGTPTANAISTVTALLRSYHVVTSENCKKTQDENDYSSTREYFAQKQCRLSESDSCRSSISSIASSISLEEIFSELDRYLALPCDEKADPLLWWQAHQ